MNPEQQRIAIAEACGYKGVTTGVTEGTIKVITGFKNHNFDEEIPDYLNDLNAMHEAAKVLKSKERMQWSDWLHKIAGYHSYDLAQATAAQRAEAFLRTLNLWKP
jgi:hypothetical protein